MIAMRIVGAFAYMVVGGMIGGLGWLGFGGSSGFASPVVAIALGTATGLLYAVYLWIRADMDYRCMSREPADGPVPPWVPAAELQ